MCESDPPVDTRTPQQKHADECGVCRAQRRTQVYVDPMGRRYPTYEDKEMPLGT